MITTGRLGTLEEDEEEEESFFLEMLRLDRDPNFFLEERDGSGTIPKLSSEQRLPCLESRSSWTLTTICWSGTTERGVGGAAAREGGGAAGVEGVDMDMDVV